MSMVKNIMGALKILFIRFIYFTVLIGVLSVFNTELIAQTDNLSTKITIKQVDQPINDILFKIAEISKLTFSFNSKLIPPTERMDLDVKDAKLSEIFEILFSNYNIDFKELDGHIIIVKRKGHKTIFKDITKNKPTETPPTTLVKEIKPEVIEPPVIEVKIDTIVEIKQDTTKSDKQLIQPPDTIKIVEPIIEESTVPDTIIEVPVVDAIVVSSAVSSEASAKEETNANYFSFQFGSQFNYPTQRSGTSPFDRAIFNQHINPSFISRTDLFYHFNKLSIGLGVCSFKIYANINSAFNIDSTFTRDVNDTISSYLVTTGNQEIWVYNIKTIETEVDTVLDKSDTISLNVTYLEFPISINYLIIDKPKWEMGLTAQLITGFAINNAPNSITKEGVEEENSGSNTNVLLSANTGFNLKYKISSNWQIGLNAGFKKALNQTYLNDHYPIKTTDFITTGIQMQYNFKKN